MNVVRYAIELENGDLHIEPINQIVRRNMPWSVVFFNTREEAHDALEQCQKKAVRGFRGARVIAVDVEIFLSSTEGRFE